MQAALARARERGADYMELNTDEGDDDAIALYQSLGFVSGDGAPGRPASYYYEREL